MRVLAAACVLVVSACTAAPVDPTPSSAPASVAATPTPEPSATAGAPSAEPSVSTTPPELSGTWRTTLVGQTVVLTLSETEGTYRIIRGSNSATGEISVDGDRIDFFNSTLCPGTGEYRWRIEGDALRFSSLTEPCPGRAEALLNLRYGEYSPPP